MKKLWLRSCKKNHTGLKNAGFTLLEISLVVVLLGVAVGIALPNLQKPYARYQLQVAARQLVSDIRYLEQLAQSKEESNYNILFDYTNDCYYLRLGATTLPNGYSDLPDSVDMLLPTFTDNELKVKIDGTVIEGGHVHLRSKTGEGDLYVIVYGFTGRVRIDTQPPS